MSRQKPVSGKRKHVFSTAKMCAVPVGFGEGTVVFILSMSLCSGRTRRDPLHLLPEGRKLEAERAILS